MSLKLANNASSTIAAAVGPGDTSMSVASGEGTKFPTLAAGDWFPATAITASGAVEIVKVTARAGDVMTVTRAQDGTAARAFAAGDALELRMTAGAYGELLQSARNLSDIAAPATARANLGVAIGVDVVGVNGNGSVPVGTTIYVNGNTAPTGFIKENGALLSRVTYAVLWAYAQASGMIVTEASWSTNQGCFSSGDGSTTFRIPDSRGEFLRGWDDSRGIDSGRTLGSSQTDALQNITGQTNNVIGAYGGTGGTGALKFTSTGAGGNYDGSNNSGRIEFDASLVARTSTETRPRNIAKLACIKY